MRAIAKGNLDGFPPADVLRTVYVEHDIDAADADTPVVAFLLANPDAQECVACPNMHVLAHSRTGRVWAQTPSCCSAMS